MSKGVCIISAGSPYYGGWALNLAMGIRHTQPDAKICLLNYALGKNHITAQLGIFDEVIEIPDEFVTRNGQKSMIRSKLCLHDLSPYDETIFIDADVIWFPTKKINDLFDELKDIDFTIGCRSKSDLDSKPRLVWSKAEDLKEFGDSCYNLSSEFIYFKKSEKNAKFFELCQTIFDNPPIKYTRFDGGVPDELAFQIAMMITDVKPHKTPYLPFYWELYEKKMKKVPEIYNTHFYGYSIGGAAVNSQQKMIYDSLVRFYSSKFGIGNPFLSKSKKDLFKTRTLI
jgi:alpha-N-acetylglucosamine transferase